MRFVAPARADVPAQRFRHPLFAGIADCIGWLGGAQWPSVAEVDAHCGGLRHAQRGHRLHFLPQNAELLADGLHYETRIAEHGVIATREHNWHDLFNAAIWRAQPAIKSAINHRQALDVAALGARQRSRRQYALTHFDEAGAVLLLRDPARLAAWDAHDWPALFLGLGDDDYAIAVIGHALLEHALWPAHMLVARCLVMLADAPRQSLPQALAYFADRIADAGALDDPQTLRPLPLAGLPGWHPQSAEEGFLRQAACFRPLRAGRRYPGAATAVVLKAEA